MPSQVNLTARTAKKINDLELAILKRANDLSAPEARIFYDDLLSAYKEFIEEQTRSFEQLHDNSSNEMVHYSLSTSDLLQNKILRLETKLVQFFKPNESNNLKQPDFTVNLDSLLQKQKLYVELIESLKPAGDISATEAETRYNHLNSLYESFILNQTEIATLVKDGYSFDSQAAIWKDVQKKVISFQSTFKKIFTPVTIAPSAESENNTNEYNSIRRQTDTIVYLNSLKQFNTQISKVPISSSFNFNFRTEKVV